MLLYVWMLILWLSPSAFCLLFVWLFPNPDFGVVLLGALTGFAVSLVVFFSLN
ncbi:hypothetical protein [Paraburkholderia sartisoli]|nr:hypothetical protein [Paraburkholderia sartisoli]